MTRGLQGVLIPLVALGPFVTMDALPDGDRSRPAP
jgi:hypothetical protein